MKRRAYADLAHYFRESGDTQEAFATRLGMYQSQISRIKNKLWQPPLLEALRIAQEANIPIESMVTIDESTTDRTENSNV